MRSDKPTAQKHYYYYYYYYYYLVKKHPRVEEKIEEIVVAGVNRLRSNITTCKKNTHHPHDHPLPV